MITYCVTVRNLKGNLVIKKEIAGISIAKVLALAGIIVSSKKYVKYERRGFEISIHKKQAGQLYLSGKAYHLECHQNLCIHYELTFMEIACLDMLIRKISRIGMIALLLKEQKVLISIKTINSHCRNLQKKTRSGTDTITASRFTA